VALFRSDPRRNISVTSKSRTCWFLHRTIFSRFTQAGSEVYRTSRRIPSAVGYQPTLSRPHGRAAGNVLTPQTKGSNYIGFRRFMFPPADDLKTDPAHGNSFGPPSTQRTVLIRDFGAGASTPAVDSPLEFNLACSRNPRCWPGNI